MAAALGARDAERVALAIHVTGIVQGVGFRPFVYRLASQTGVKGWVLNGTDGVRCVAEGSQAQVGAFVMGISEKAPAAARVERIHLDEVSPEGFEDFSIRSSDDDGSQKTTLVSPDLATCDDCLAELFDPANRRYRYPFINCTNCGPRFTIIEKLPYDRPYTSMKRFPMCPECAAEYADPSDRRFHAQPDACWECGPHISLAVPAAAALDALSSALDLPDAAEWETIGEMRRCWGSDRRKSDAILSAGVDLLRSGGILALKGLGGFHLVCDAANPQALLELRKRKRREGKAFAVMAGSVEWVRATCHVSREEEALLKSPARPIVLLRKRASAKFAPGLADGLPELGVMLPSTPLQHLLLDEFGDMLVMTSGNVHDEPIQTDDCRALEALAGIADAFIGNNRPIRSRYDDSVVRVLDFGGGTTATQVIRRARGLAPLPISTEVLAGEGDDKVKTVFATGPEQKVTLCLTRPGEAFVSQHIGDMENAATNDAWLEAKGTYESLLRLEADAVACDEHPEYLTSKWAAAQDLPVVPVQHHHAHIVSVMAENNLEGPVCGIAFDGTGYGEDGAIWGGEVLLANLQTYERFCNFAYFPLPGGAAAIKNPLRCAYGALWAFDLLEHPGAEHLHEALGEAESTLSSMIERGINTPHTSSVGRLFDAASALLGLCEKPAYEGEGAVLLEAAVYDSADLASDERYRVEIVKNTATAKSTARDTSVLLADPAPLLQALLEDIAAGVPAGVCARRFHDAIAEAIVVFSQLAYRLYELRTVVLSGGVFMNRYLMERVVAALSDEGFTVAIGRDLPPNDACISLGQAVVALHTS